MSSSVIASRRFVLAIMAVGCTGGGLLLTSAPAPAAVPDGRVYEMVTPVENYDSDIYVPRDLPANLVENAAEFETKLPFQVASDGEAVAYVGSPTVKGTGQVGFGFGNEYLSKRLPGGGWGPSVNIQPEGVYNAFYQAFSPDLTSGVLQSGAAEEPTNAPLSPQAPSGGYPVLYTRSFEAGENYQSLFTTKPPNRAPSEFEASKVPKIYGAAPQQLAFAGGSEGFGRLLFEANDALAGTGAVDGGAGENNLYESSAGRLSLVNVLPDGSTEANATFGAPPFGNHPREENLPDFGNVISADGSRVFWTDLNPGKENLYVSEGVGSGSEHTAQVDASQVPGGVGGGGRYWGANKEGTRVFFTDSDAAELTSDTHTGSGVNLYMYEVLTGQLVDLTSAADAEVEGVLGEGETEAGEYTVYFTAKGVLDETANSNGAKAEPGADNLYMLAEDGKPTFIAVLSEQDGKQSIEPLSRSGREEYGDWQPGLGRRTAEATPDGRGLVFMSNNQEFDGHFEEVAGERLQEVYVYEPDHGGLFCASCARPGVSLLENPSASAPGGLAAYLPVSNSASFMPTWISGDGSKVFFDDDEPVVPSDTNNEQDVYEWERDGAGGCEEAAGCVYLLSGGDEEASSWLIGASANGNDVFMVTRAKLAPGDGNEAYDVYDDRVDGVQAISEPACLGTGCQGLPSAPPVFATPPTATFSGVGNFPPPVQVTAKSVVKPKPKKKSKKGSKKRPKSRLKGKGRSRGGTKRSLMGPGNDIREGGR